MAILLPHIDLMRMAEVPGMVNGVVVVGKEVGVDLANYPRFIVQLNAVRSQPSVPFGL